MNHGMLDKLDKLLGTNYRVDAKYGPWRATIIRGQARGAKVAHWRVETPHGEAGGVRVLGSFANEQFSSEAVEALNEAHVFYCAIRGTSIEKEYFP